jgi:hypothetical protein
MKNAVFWNIKAHFIPHRKQYVSATEPSRVILCEICGFHDGDYEECRLLGCDAVWLLGSHKRNTASHPRRRHSSSLIRLKGCVERK